MHDMCLAQTVESWDSAVFHWLKCTGNKYREKGNIS